jgi:hypothetical protein
MEEHDEMRVKWDARISSKGVKWDVRVSSKGENTIRGVNLGTFTTCFKIIHLQNVLDLILDFSFYVWDLYFNFQKFNLI